MSNVLTLPATLPRLVQALHALAVCVGMLLFLVYAFAVPHYVMLDRHLLFAAFMATGVVGFGIEMIYPTAIGDTWWSRLSTVLINLTPFSRRQVSGLFALLALGGMLHQLYAAYG